MNFFFLQRYRLGRTGSSLLLLISLSFLFFLASCAQGQSVDSLIHVSAAVSTEYADIIRKRSDQSSMTVFMREFDASITAVRGFDTLILGYSSWNQYSSYNQHSSSIAVSAENSLRSLSLQWISSIAWIDYSGTVLIPFSYRLFPLHYRAGIRLKPVGAFFTSSFIYERIPTTFSSGLGFKDFSFPLDERSTGSAWNMELQSSPVEWMQGSFSWGKRITTTKGEAEGFSSPLDWNTQMMSAQLRFFSQEQPCAWLGWNWNDGKGKTPFAKDNLKFGSLSYGAEYFYHVYAGGKANISSIPISCNYHYRRWEGEAHGHMESWPFLSFAESIFANRITFECFGNIDIHQFESKASLNWGGCKIEPTLGILYIIPDISLLYREYDLPPIVKKVTRDEFSIQNCWLLQIKCQVEFPIFHLRVALELEQYIPIIVKDRQIAGSAGSPSTAKTQSTTSNTLNDGGRRLHLQVFLP
jgi:hypothetical protein